MQVLKKFSLIALLIIAVTVLSNCSQKSTEQTKKTETSNNPQTVIIENFSFSPAELTVEKGTQVTWANEDTAPHTISIEGSLDSPKFNRGDSFSYTFNELGEFSYYCSIHPSMKGVIIVQ